jgi:Ca2+-binding RTX toxin-like protein
MPKKTVLLTPGNDIWGGWEKDVNYSVFGHGGDDKLYGYLGNDTIDGGNGNDSIYGSASSDVLLGGQGQDLLDGGAGNDSIYGGDDNDRIFGGDGNDSLFGDAGQDLLYGYNGADWMFGGDGNDSLYGENDYDTLQGDAGNDFLDGGSGNDFLAGGSGADTLYGAGDNDLLYGDDDNDDLQGGDGADTLYGGRGNDLLSGGNGNDILDANSNSSNHTGSGSIDTLVGGTGNDRFVLGNASFAYYDDGQVLGDGSTDYVIIKDLHRLKDKIQLSGSVNDYVVGNIPAALAGQRAIDTAGIYVDKDNSKSLTANDELIAVVENISSSKLVLDKGLFEGTNGVVTQFHPATSSDWELVFSDEFSGSSLDSSKWNTRYKQNFYGGRTNIWNNEEQYYVGDNEVINGITYDAFKFSNDVMSIVGQKLDQPITADILQPVAGMPSTQTFNYSSGIISGHDKQAFINGYMEIRAKVPTGTSLWPAFWLLPSSGGWPPEIDVMESIGNQPNTIYTSSHFTDNSGNHGSHTSGHTFTGEDGINFSQDFHTYAAQWDSNRLTWFIDGQAVFDVRQNIPDVPMYLLANLAIGGNWPGATNGTTPVNSSYDIDYIRVYQDKLGTLLGGNADDTLTKNLGNLSGESGNDRLTSGTGDNLLNGGTGNDVLIGSMGRDTFIGGAGTDNFVLASSTGLFYDDRNTNTSGLQDVVYIKDFNLLEDKITLLGSASYYGLNTTLDGLSTEIWSKQSTDDLIAVLDSVQLSNFNQGFAFI